MRTCTSETVTGSTCHSAEGSRFYAQSQSKSYMNEQLAYTEIKCMFPLLKKTTFHLYSTTPSHILKQSKVCFLYIQGL